MINIRSAITTESSTLRVTISIEREIVLHSFLLASIVTVLKTELNTIAVEILRQLFTLLDDAWLREKGSSMKACKFLNRALHTGFGWVRFRYRQAQMKGGKHFRPLLDMLGIEKGQRRTADLMETSMLSVLYTSYRKALKIAGHVCSLGALWYTVQKEGKRYIQKRDKAIYYYSEGDFHVEITERDFAILLIDEIWIRHTKKKKHIRVKVARLGVFRHTENGFEGMPVCIYATAKGNQKSFLKKTKEFFDAACGLHRIPRIIVVTDGCEMGRDICALYPEGQAVWQLDWWHLWNYVHKGCKWEKDLEKNVWELLNVEKVDEALGLLCAYREAMKCMEKKLHEYGQKVSTEEPSMVKPTVFWSSHQLSHLEKLITYISNNREGIYGVRAFVKDIPAEYLPFGSGPVERLQAVMIAYRMKKQGKHWSVEGADNLVQLLSKEWNGENLERILEEGIEGFDAWDELCGKGVKLSDEETVSPVSGKKKKRTDFSPRPAMCVPLLKRGRTDSFYAPMKGISNLKMIPHIVDFREEGCLES
jgi:hypothetical protein